MFSALTFALVPGADYTLKQVEIQRKGLRKNGARVIETISGLPAADLAVCVIVVGAKPGRTTDLNHLVSSLKCTEQQLRDAVAAGAAVVASALVSSSLDLGALQDLDTYAVALPPPRALPTMAVEAAGPPAKRARGDDGSAIATAQGTSGSLSVIAAGSAVAPSVAAAAAAASTAVTSSGGAVSGFKRPRSSLEAAGAIVDAGAATVALSAASAATATAAAVGGAGTANVSTSASLAYAATMSGGSGASSSSSVASAFAPVVALPACVGPGFPLNGVSGDGFGVLRVPPSAVEAVTIPRGVWLNTMVDVVFAAPFNHGGGSSSTTSSSSSSSGASAMGLAAAAAPVVLPGLGALTGSGMTEASIRAARRSAYETMTPRSMGACHVFTTPGCDGRSKVLSLDMDGTLIRPKSGAKFCNRDDDWQFAFPNVASKLLAAHREGYKIVVFSNQAGISKNITTAEIVRRRFEKFAAKVSADAAAAAAAAADGTSSSSAASATPLVPMQMLFAPGDGFFRKPFAGMFYLLASKLNDGVPIDVGSSLYVGDAAGRPETAKGAKNRDHSASDMEFAINCGLPFATPEAFFCGDSTPRHRSPYTAWLTTARFVAARDLPRPTESREVTAVAATAASAASSSSSSSLGSKGGLLAFWKPAPATSSAAAAAVATAAVSSAAAVAVAALPPLQPAVPPTSPELVLLVGPAATGKSFLCATVFPYHVRVNQDLLKTLPKCKEAAKAALAAGNSVIADNTNLGPEARQEWLKLAKALNVPVRAIIIDSPGRFMSLHLNAVRAANPLGDLEGPCNRRSVPDVVINKMYKDLNVDAKQLRSDGFTDVHTWRFVPAGLDVASGDAAEAFQQACLYACTDV